MNRRAILFTPWGLRPIPFDLLRLVFLNQLVSLKVTPIITSIINLLKLAHPSIHQISFKTFPNLGYRKNRSDNVQIQVIQSSLSHRTINSKL